ncbi:hypothetical protein [Lysobacter capsici]|uniref:hypothetical protein n=1 Tax=Lysobacter capsici TaxID=435897 RepID=UPI00287BAFD1|nr:hypothetical protein [Lysobacter capsici]WND80669.1 hypothetical protein RJ610_25890 [Lysobacter capsici]WND85865.1 hypothetical protein RJ609_25910 [Lysobacter capsici]
MTISPELQAKIDSLEDERLKAEIIEVLTGPGEKRASDDAIYEAILASYTMATTQQAKLRKWREEEVAAFAQYLKENRPEDYAEFLRQEKDFSEIDAELAWDIRRIMREWILDLNSDDRSELFSEFRQYVRSRVN